MLQSDPSKIMNWDAIVYIKQQEWIEMKLEVRKFATEYEVIQCC